MKNAILAVVIAAGVGGFVSSSAAEEVKQLRLHPDAAADPSLQRENVELPAAGVRHPGGASASSTRHASRVRPKTGVAVASERPSTSQSKQTK
jgi:hypothetical protein